MKIYYVKYRDDVDVWLDDCNFYATEEKAREECELLENKSKALWLGSYQRNFEKWEKTEVAYQALLDIGLDPKEVFPYHKRQWPTEVYKLRYTVGSVEVEE